MAKKTMPDGARWVTVKKSNSPLHGRHIMIDAKGNVIGGNLPKAFQGHHIGQLAGIKPTDTDYHQYTPEELKEVHDSFQKHHDDLQRELAEDVHGMAKQLHGAHKEKVGGGGLIQKIRKLGGIRMGEGDDIHTDYKESIPASVRRAVGSKEGKKLDELADELGMSADDLKNRLSQVDNTGDSKPEDFHEEAKKQMGEDYTNRIEGLKELKKHIKAIQAAMQRHEQAAAAKKAESTPKERVAIAASKEEPQASTAAPVQKAKKKEPQREEEKPGPVEVSHVEPSPAPKKSGRNRFFDELHNDVHAHISGKMSEEDFIKKHKNLFDRMGKKAAERRNKENDAEDFGQEASTAALKTLRALKSGSQKAKEGQNLGEHLLRRVHQGMSETARQANENPLSRNGTKLAAIVNSIRNEHINEKGAEPSEDELFNRVKDHHVFQSTPYAASGTKKTIEDAREKFNAVREAMKGQSATSSLDEKVKGKDGDTGTVGDNIKDEGSTPEERLLQKEKEAELQEKRNQLHNVLKQFGLSDSEAFAVRHRFGVGHAESGFKDWNEVAKHMGKDLNKNINPETAKKHFNNGRAKLHAHIGDERMGMLMAKSLLDDLGVANLVYHLHMLGIYDMLMKSFAEITDDMEVPSVWIRTETAENYGGLMKSLQPEEFIESMTHWADGTVTAHVHALQRG